MAGIDVKQVCKICYVSSSHKPNPILTPESKILFDGAGAKSCSICRQGWAPIRIARDAAPGSSGGRWVRIRPRPKINASTEFQMCKNIQGGRGECPRGLDCSYAHYRVELALWNVERKQEPRPAPLITGSYQYQMCKHMQGSGACPYGQRCTFAHSQEEFRAWLRNMPSSATFSPTSPLPSSGSGPVGGLVCEVCTLTCTSRKQLEDHMAGGKHRERLLQLQNGVAEQLPAHPPPSNARKRPHLSFQIPSFKMCMHAQANRRCVYGDFCTFAHSNEELQEWNRQLAPPTNPQNIVRFQPPPLSQGQPRPNIFTASSGLDDFDEAMAETARDFADEIRRRVAEEFTTRQDVAGFEASRDGVSVNEVTGQELCLTWTHPDSLHWIFEISSVEARVLESVVLLDSLAADFIILGAWLVQYRGQQSPLSGTAAEQGAGLLLSQRIAGPDKLHVKVSLKPRSGVLGQVVIFNFGSFYLTRGLSIQVLNEAERRLVANMRSPQRPTKPDLYWEQHYTSIALPGREIDEVFDAGLAEYPLPEQIEKLIEAGKYNNVENRVTRENYKRRLHNLLYLEEYQQRLDMSRYDLYDVEIKMESVLHTPHGALYAMEGFHYMTVSVEEVLFEGGRSVRPGDSALLLPMNQQVVHECWVEAVGRDKVTLKLSEKARQASVSSRSRCSLRFVLSRTHMREMHYAVDQVNMNVVFPEARESAAHSPPTPPAIFKCLHELKSTKLSKSQKEAINSMLDPACQQIPSLVLGPFGCGKTRTLHECIMLLSLLHDTTILVCTHSNSAANIYIQELSKEFAKKSSERVSMLRVYYTGRRIDTIPLEVRPYCKFQDGRLVLPSLSELKQYRIVVVTLSTSRALSLMGLPKGHFSHIFIDEAAQALESETLVPLVLASDRTKVVLAGDHMQLDPPCYSHIARKYGLHVSLLERLYDHEAYNSGVRQLCKTLLTENHRSHAHIMEIPSKLFYKNKLTCRAEFPSTGPQDIAPLKFIGVDGQEAQDEDSPSYYNDHEALEVTKQVKLLVKGGLSQDEVCVLSYYQKQVTRIRHLLRNERLGQVSVFRVDDVQGKEFRALLLSTVRTCYARDDADLEEDAGFLTNPKLFNTAVTRAKEWLIVCGEPVTLCTVGSNRLCWAELIKKCLHQLDSFEYPNASRFEDLLQTKIFTRQILEKKNENFFQKIKKVSAQPVTHPTPVATAPATAQPAASPQQRSPVHVKYEVLKSQVSGLARGNDDATINKITDELMKLSVQDQSGLLARPEVLRQRVREIESVLRRPGPTAALLNSTAVPNSILGQGAQMIPGPYPVMAQKYAPDLPPFLTSIIDGITNYMKWCDMHLHSPQNNRPGVKDNLTRQRNNLTKQSQLVNEQITMYRELLQIVRTTTMDNPALRGTLPNMAPQLRPPHHHVMQPPPVAHYPPPPVHHQQQFLQQMRPGVFQPATGGQQENRHLPSSANTAFTYGVSYFPNADPEEPQLSVQTNLTPSGKTKRLSPLEAAINDVSSHSSPQPPPPDTSTDVYLSDDEFNS